METPSKLSDLKCPNCKTTGFLRFSHSIAIDTAVTSVVCSFCGTEFPVPSRNLNDVVLEALRYGEEASRVKIVGSGHLEPVQGKWYPPTVKPPMYKEVSFPVVGEISKMGPKHLRYREVVFSEKEGWGLTNGYKLNVFRWTPMPIPPDDDVQEA